MPRTRPRAKLSSMEAAQPERATVRLELDLGSEPISGVLWREGETQPHPFRGWLQLTNLIEVARAREER